MNRGAAILFIGILLVTAASAQDLPEVGTTYSVDLQEGGSASWTIEQRYQLESQEEISIFEDYVLEFQDNRSDYITEFKGEMEATLKAASSASGRPMRGSAYTVYIKTEHTPTGVYGVVVYRFDWEGFANTSGNSIMVGDALPDGLFLSQDYTLIINYPSEYKVVKVSPEPDQRNSYSLIWYGMRAFSPEEPHIELKANSGLSFQVLILILGGLAVAGACYYMHKSYREPDKESDRTESDEDTVLHLLEEAGRELYQSEIVKQTGFSKSKVSAIIKSLKENGRIQKIRKGRENLIRLK
ncbi:MAG: helix-turn-helix domain-containing protein [Methanocellales archaeon]|nr:helix-turn-helix domain-containing protein [Methanocellales archaeon]MDD3291446.1 helix-turn-helix domain-containing protein [Methanocellales archaeon]MDD5234664.1 helix-turn-helix domain-containing protein [Methanocellales archaeon]MDD5484984.1 helix-turn-helix domain-containing protein [Methanocellales archaeon]